MKHIVVTGANKGIGLAMVEQILTQHEDTFVFLGSRSEERGRAALRGLLEKQPAWEGRSALLVIDVSSDDSVAAAAETVRARLDGASLYGIVNNAGIGFGSADLEGIFNVNTRGLKRTSDAFLPLLDSAGGRIVNITSAAGPNFVSGCNEERQAFLRRRDLSWEELDSFMNDAVAISNGDGDFGAKGFGGGNAYGFSKACGNSYTMLLATQFPELRINACTPGFIATDMTRPYADAQGKSPEDMGMKSPAEGTRSTLFLLFGDPAGNGNYYGSDAMRSPIDRYRAPGDPEYQGD